MYEVSVEAIFSASHRVRLGDGTLEPLHGHDWRVTVIFAGPSLDETGILVDFEAASRKLDEVVRRLHHTDLNDNPLLRGANPSAEHVARSIFDALREDDALARRLTRVTVTEAPGCSASYLVGPADSVRPGP